MAVKCSRNRGVHPLPSVWIPHLHEVVITPQLLVPSKPAFHQGFVLKLHFSGKSRGHIEKKLYDFLPGEGVLIFPFQLHHVISVDPPEGQIRLIVDFTLPPEDQQVLEPLRGITFKLDSNEIELLIRMVDLIASPDEESQHEAFSLLTKFIAGLPKKAASASNKTSANPMMREVFNFLYDHYREGLTVKEIAERLGYSESGVRVMFRRETGRTPGIFMQELRLRDAATQLLASKDSIQKIGRDCGFSNAFIFSRAFKRFFGAAPKLFREMGIGTHDVHKFR